MTPPRWLAPVFFLSGAAGLALQVVWMRMLVRVFGISSDATAAVVAVYMGGLAAGALGMARLLEGRPASLALYARIEAAVALSAALATAAMARLPALYAALAGPPEPGAGGGAAARLALSAAVLGAPTVLMGATLPLLTRVTTGEDGAVGARLAALYGWNTLGAVAGAALAGFVGLAVLGESGTAAAACSLALGVALFAGTRPEARAPAAAAATPRLDRVLLSLGALSGFAALALEVLWTRLLIPLMGSSVYAFSATLAVYLAGVGLGSLAAGRRLDRLKDPLAAFGWGQCLLALVCAASLRAYGALGLRMSHPRYLYSPLQSAADLAPIVLTVAALVLPATLLLGALFPTLHRALARTAGESGPAAGRLYAWNTLGGVAGALAAGHLLLPLLGAQAAFAATAFLALLTGTLALARGGALKNPAAAAALAGTAAAAASLMPLSRPLFLDIVSERLARLGAEGRFLFHEEDEVAAVTGVRLAEDGSRDVLLLNGILTSGKGTAGAAMVELPLLLHGSAERALVVCFGVGTTFRTALARTGRADAVELVGGVLRAFRHFHEDADAVLAHPGARVFIDDGRNHLLRSKERYDAVVVDASPPIFSAGAVNLYSAEFVALVRDRLTPRGTFALWVPTPCFEGDFWRIARNFADAFPSVWAWAHPGLDGLLLMGSLAPLDASPEAVGRVLRAAAARGAPAALTPEAYAAGWTLDDAALRRRAAAFPPVTDDRPRTEFPLGALLRGERLWKDGAFLAPTGP